MKYINIYLAQANSSYNCGVYGAGTYNSNECNASTDAGGSAANNGTLADTGYDIILPVALAVSIIVAAIIYTIRQIRRRKG